MTINVLIVGAGQIAGLNELDQYREKPCSHVGAYLNNSNFEVVGVVDVNIEKAKKFSEIFDIENFFQDVEDALKALPELVSIATPYQFHHQVVEAV